MHIDRGNQSSLTRRQAFTLIELLTVIAVIGILAAIIIPTVGGAQDSATRAKTKAQFGQWAAAMELYRQEYGFYPDVVVGGLIDSDKFAAELTGRTLSGQAISRTLFGNRKALSFYTIGADELSEDGTELVDGFGNTEIGVRTDSNRDGIINSADSGAWTSVVGASGSALSPTSQDGVVPTTGVRAGVVLYSAGRGRDGVDLILSWR
jgi:prepilin-type N-terminal cleavage/methylation domain-containing protein